MQTIGRDWGILPLFTGVTLFDRIARAVPGRLPATQETLFAAGETARRGASSRGYTVYTQNIPAAITPKNRLMLAAPS